MVKRRRGSSGNNNHSVNYMSKQKLISVVVPVFNEEENIGPAYKEILRVFAEYLGNYDYEIIFTDNASTDRSLSILEALANNDERVTVVSFSRNFGFDRSLLTGYRIASGDCALQLDCDLQDPPELLPKFIEKWNLGHDAVVGVRRMRNENKALTFLRKIHYRVLNRFSEGFLTVDAGDFRLIDRSILDVLRCVNEPDPYVRGLVAALSSNECPIVYDRNSRKHGASKFGAVNLMKLGLNGFISYSYLPLRIAVVVGSGISFLAAGLAMYYVISSTFFDANWPDGLMTIVILQLFSVGIISCLLGVMSEYLGRIYRLAKGLPITTIRTSFNLKPESLKHISL